MFVCNGVTTNFAGNNNGRWVCGYMEIYSVIRKHFVVTLFHEWEKNIPSYCIYSSNN